MGGGFQCTGPARGAAEVVALGGGVIEALEQEMMPTITKLARDHVLPGTMKGIEIVASKLGDNAGIAGDAVLAQRSLKRG